MADTPSAPPLPDGSVDFNAIDDAAREGRDLGEAIKKATFVHPDKVATEDATEIQYADGTPFDELKPADPPATKTGKSGSKEA